MLFELVKNSLRAVQDRFADSDDPAPPIRLVVAEGGEDVTLKVKRLCACVWAYWAQGYLRGCNQRGCMKVFWIPFD